MIPDKVPKEDVFYASEELKKKAHIPSFDKYKELYLKSIESPDGKRTISDLKRGAERNHEHLLKHNF